MLFLEAEFVIGPHGAGFTNIIACAKHITLLEFMPRNKIEIYFENLTRELGHRYLRMLVANSADDASSLFVDPKELCETLKACIGPVLDQPYPA